MENCVCIFSHDTVVNTGKLIYLYEVIFNHDLTIRQFRYILEWVWIGCLLFEVVMFYKEHLSINYFTFVFYIFMG